MTTRSGGPSLAVRRIDRGAGAHPKNFASEIATPTPKIDCAREMQRALAKFLDDFWREDRDQSDT
jgi:hypothetical protein